MMQHPSAALEGPADVTPRRRCGTFSEQLPSTQLIESQSPVEANSVNCSEVTDIDMPVMIPVPPFDETQAASPRDRRSTFSGRIHGLRQLRATSHNATER